MEKNKKCSCTCECKRSGTHNTLTRRHQWRYRNKGDRFWKVAKSLMTHAEMREFYNTDLVDVEPHGDSHLVED